MNLYESKISQVQERKENFLIKAVFVLMVSSSDAKTIFSPLAHGYSRQIDLYLQEVREKNTPPSNLEIRNGKQNHAILLNPLIMQFFTFGEMVKAPTNLETIDSDDVRQYLTNVNAVTPSADSSKNSENSAAYYLTSSDTNQQPTMPTNSYQESNNDTSIAAFLPTITTPFFDSLTHAIVGEIQQHVQLIKPGTKWCGDGNKARSYEDVGVLYKTDKCCRTHDKCPYFILAHETKYGLHNEAHFTRSHCDCDASFYDCLKKVNSPFSTSVGITYFNLLKMKCFRYEYPVLMCSNTSGWLSKHCVEYIVDMRKQKQWQWFDNHEF